MFDSIPSYTQALEACNTFEEFCALIEDNKHFNTNGIREFIRHWPGYSSSHEYNDIQTAYHHYSLHLYYCRKFAEVAKTSGHVYQISARTYFKKHLILKEAQAITERGSQEANLNLDV